MSEPKQPSWTDEQRELFETASTGLPRHPRVAVSADAGAGKTSVLVERVRNLKLGSGKRVLCVSFTEKSKADLEQKLSAWLVAEVYTIHGFCARLVGEFGSLLSLSPVSRIMDQDESDDLFHQAFEKTYRREPPRNVEHNADVFLKLCRKARDIGPGAEVEDCGGGSGNLSEFVRQVLAEYDSSKLALRALEYADLEKYALKLLEKKEVAGALRNRYGHVFVDEFQDTSRLQCRLVELLTGRDGMVFVVGDEKQSIYRFRGADVRVFQEFVAKLPAQKRLSANFRSHPDVVEAVNSVCSPVIEGYEAMTAGRVERSEVWPKVFDSEWPRVARIAAERDVDGIESILQRLRARGVDWSQVVLLLRRIKGNEELFEELGKRGIGVAATSASSASSSDALGKLLNLWIWSVEPWQKLRAAQVAVDFSEMSREKALEAIDALESPSVELGRVSCETLLCALDRRFRLQERFGAIYEQFELFVLRHQSEGLSPSQLARRLHRLLSNEQDIGGFILLPPPANMSGAIRVLTVHSSKGLEFPVVILADLRNRRSPSQSFVASGQRVWLPARNDKGELDKSREDIKAALGAEKEADEAERARLLYVAMTRAEEALYVVDRAEPTNKTPDQSWSEWLRAGLTTTLSSVVIERAVGARSITTERQPSVAGVGRSIPIEPNPPLYTRARIGVTELAGQIAGSGGSAKPAEPVAPKASLRSPGIRATDLGEIVHKYLEDEDWDGLKKAALKYRFELAAFWRWIESPDGRFVFGGAERAYPEFAFEWKTERGIVAGRIDRLVVSGSARALTARSLIDETWVVDYKILGHARSKEDLLETYSPQLRIYAEAVKNLTKAPRVRAFILDVVGATGQVWHEVDT